MAKVQTWDPYKTIQCDNNLSAPCSVLSPFSQINSLSFIIYMVPLELPNFKFRLFFMGLGLSIPLLAPNQIVCSSTPSSSLFPSTNQFQPNSSQDNEPTFKKLNQPYDKLKVFQNTWATQFPWVQFILGPYGLISQVKCVKCNHVKGILLVILFFEWK